MEIDNYNIGDIVNHEGTVYIVKPYGKNKRFSKIKESNIIVASSTINTLTIMHLPIQEIKKFSTDKIKKLGKLNFTGTKMYLGEFGYIGAVLSIFDSEYNVFTICGSLIVIPNNVRLSDLTFVNTCKRIEVDEGLFLAVDNKFVKNLSVSKIKNRIGKKIRHSDVYGGNNNNTIGYAVDNITGDGAYYVYSDKKTKSYMLLSAALEFKILKNLGYIYKIK